MGKTRNACPATRKSQPVTEERRQRTEKQQLFVIDYWLLV
ncbi:hypothetical protein D1AOALGA4SA_8190 [Olavius algarvensis Delta 1 endosymbiont]|nr:hypothetical protein D1AOALGA4SA_8190 [Olavius algarvensis Delta 1 endosymbiont]